MIDALIFLAIAAVSVEAYLRLVNWLRPRPMVNHVERFGHCAACYRSAPLVNGECPDCRH